MPYIRKYLPNHPRADVTGFVGEHLLVMEKILGKEIPEDMVVHHLDHHKPNNDPKNLLLLTRKEHQQIPIMQARFIVEKGLMREFVDWWCIHKDEPQTHEQRLENEITRLENDLHKLEAKHSINAQMPISTTSSNND